LPNIPATLIFMAFSPWSGVVTRIRACQIRTGVGAVMSRHP
jgi:hypothetical protein